MVEARIAILEDEPDIAEVLRFLGQASPDPGSAAQMLAQAAAAWEPRAIPKGLFRQTPGV